MEEDPSSAWLSLRVRRQNSFEAEAELGIQRESFVEKNVKEMIKHDCYIHITYRSVSRANRWSNDWNNCWMFDAFFFSLIIHHFTLISKNTSAISKYSSDMSNIQIQPIH